MPRSPKSYLTNLETQSECIEALEVYYWVRGRYSVDIRPKCQWCGSDRVHLVRKMKNIPDLYQCNFCKRQFNVWTNTPFQGTKIKLRKWFDANFYYKKPGQYKIEDIAKKIGYSKRDTVNLIKKIKQLDKEFADERGFEGESSFGFFSEVGRRHRSYLNQKKRKAELKRFEELGVSYSIRPKTGFW